ncbi:hypothetical protein BLNAU_17597 [Blattamonas nauphoetae]|uniref:Uncharacterized protein n=1 Tax=Blattamonas nauphoetae TaxID=2049346 RepID=A0ABQ9X6P9_9EUKA|nr:hypothetical protein BLNAU_17597 [Blattamonas nauphoetae]
MQLCANTPTTAIGFIRSSNFAVSRSEITSCPDTSPFVIGHSGVDSSVSVSIIWCTHKSSSELSSLLPLVSGPPSLSPSTHMPSNEEGCTGTFGIGSLSIVGAGLNMKSAHFVVGTGPLFDFGNCVGNGLTGVVDCSVSLSGSSLTNTTSTRLPSTFPRSCSFLTQRLIGVSVSDSTNHLCGTSGMPLDWAGSSLLSNCSFTSCVTNDAPDPISEPTQDPTKEYDEHDSENVRISRIQSLTNETISNTLWVMSCVFANLSGSARGLAIYCSNFRADVVVKDCSFEECHSTNTNSSGGAVTLIINFNLIASRKFYFTIFNCRFTNNTATFGGHFLMNMYAPVTVAQCTFKDSRSGTATPLAQHHSIHIYLDGDCRFDNSTVSNNEGDYTGGIMLHQELETGSIFLTDVLFKDNIYTYPNLTERVTDFYFDTATGSSHAEFFDCFSTSAVPHCTITFAATILPDLIGPSITSVSQTIRENEDGDGYEITLTFEGVFPGTSRKYDVTLKEPHGHTFVAENMTFTKTAGTGTFAFSNPSLPDVWSATTYKIVDVRKSSSQATSNELVFEGETEPDWTWWHHTLESRADNMVGLPFTTPAGPTLTSIKAELNPTNVSEVVVTLTVDSISTGEFHTDARSASDDSSGGHLGPFFFSSSSTPTSSSCIVDINTGHLFFGKTYIVDGLHSSTLVVSHNQPNMTVPYPPTKIESAFCHPHPDLTTFNLELGGMFLPVGMRWTATLSTGYTISGSFTSDTMGASETQTFEEDGVYFGMLYTVANVSLENGTVVILHGVVFHTPESPLESAMPKQAWVG